MQIAETDAARQAHRPAERLGGVAVEIACRARIDRAAGEVPRRRIGDVERDVEVFRRDLNQ